MPVPDFQSIMLPLLDCFKDRKEHSNDAINECLARYFNLTNEEMSQLLPSGKQRVFGNRVAWAKTNLKQAGLIESTGRGLYRILPKGEAVLAENPSSLSIKYLMKFPGFRNFREGKVKTGQSDAGENCNEGKTPQEYIDIGYEKILHRLSDELIETIRKSSPYFF
ncbi:winged helix-turn-helix domain-containing protein [Solidesulfovibrio alcoholivorans]|uniref:winged helix-turn-helix domain-containing protein n=1 Tax=Solidesulfovibrio alcoholivorans TaxID=81406 RepID=UPI001B805494|nr:winged helix-turn-helix domain-containing protein [Solidesulfovibrio alcoholivorans]